MQYACDHSEGESFGFDSLSAFLNFQGDGDQKAPSINMALQVPQDCCFGFFRPPRVLQYAMNTNDEMSRSIVMRVAH